jgi:hypothetical protein
MQRTSGCTRARHRGVLAALMQEVSFGSSSRYCAGARITVNRPAGPGRRRGDHLLTGEE